VGSCVQLVWSFIIVRQIRLQDVMTVRLDAAEKLVIRCTEHVGDGRLVDPAAAQPLASQDEHAPDHAGDDGSTEYIL